MEALPKDINRTWVLLFLTPLFGGRSSWVEPVELLEAILDKPKTICPKKSSPHATH